MGDENINNETGNDQHNVHNLRNCVYIQYSVVIWCIVRIIYNVYSDIQRHHVTKLLSNVETIKKPETGAKQADISGLSLSGK